MYIVLIVMEIRAICKKVWLSMVTGQIPFPKTFMLCATVVVVVDNADVTLFNHSPIEIILPVYGNVEDESKAYIHCMYLCLCRTIPVLRLSPLRNLLLLFSAP